MEESQLVANFLDSLVFEEKRRLFNDLLAVEEVYQMNKNTSFYTFRKVKQASKRHVDCRKRIFRYQNSHNEELIIEQIHEQRFFKNNYTFKVFFNLEEYNFSFVENILAVLRDERMRHYTQPKVVFG
ncbi:hypothetical protein JZO76_08625 [Enterococcus sp. MJM12]|uniref:Uncharacterized protein n=1 Tax=Candidatus Enterococcus myersii TaxID=2815322 RepID=A0ABS3H843_9ENTE|nr:MULTISPECIES: hypothetical protein [Enterococcus]MBO0449604.1 hypothetical protein [Enterococcus sp. MJM12]MCD1024947.1 hypothetical protein [Enterococcus sp. SMC-9]MDT2740685.1 hypothetical protein [Enterococcus canintestini]